jgi:predicted metal-dependent HD superfamily phosphohydrolase
MFHPCYGAFRAAAACGGRGGTRNQAATALSRRRRLPYPPRTMANTDRAETTRFEALWHRCLQCPPSPAASVVHARLRELLGAPDRHFHNLDHIRECLRHFEVVVPLLADPDAVELALWFHDAIYAPGDPTNERRSAELFVQLASGATPVLRRRVCGLVLATRHASVARTSDRRFIEDIDLAGFGAPWDQFMRHGDLLRREFGAQPDAQYYAGQVAFLELLARRPVFFATDFYRERYEARARENLQRLLDLRRAEGYRAAPRDA